jgi:hypothetical protein
MLDQNKFDRLLGQRKYSSSLLSDCIYEFVILIARGGQDVHLVWSDDGTRYEYEFHDRDELRLLLDLLPLHRVTLMYRCGYVRIDQQQPICFPFDDNTPPQILQGFRDAMQSLPRYWACVLRPRP